MINYSYKTMSYSYIKPRTMVITTYMKPRTLEPYITT